jgi:type IV secretion system protein VirB2
MNRRFSLVALLVVLASNAFAAGTGMPWETPLRTITNSITGPTAYLITLGGLGIGLAGYIFSRSQELGEVVQFGMKVVMAGGTMIFAAPMLTILLGAMAATV